MANKICYRCKRDKNTSDFGNDKTHSDGLKSSCKECCREDGRQHSKRMYQKRKGYLSSRYQTYKSNTGPKCHWRKSKAKKEFCLTIEQFDSITRQRCRYCNAFSPGKEYCGVDRIDDSKGYTIDNCVPCCSTCNMMKRSWSVDEFLDHIASIQSWQEDERNKHARPRQSMQGSQDLQPMPDFCI